MKVSGNLPRILGKLVSFCPDQLNQKSSNTENIPSAQPLMGKGDLLEMC